MKKIVGALCIALGCTFASHHTAHAKTSEYIVETKHIQQLQHTYGAKKLSKIKGAPIYKVRLDASKLKSIKNDKRVVSISKNKTIQLPATKVTATTKATVGDWGFTSMNFPAANPFLSDVKVGVIDSGIDTDHPALKAQITDGFYAEDFTSVEDENGHGTHVAGIIANGTPNIQIVPMRILDKYGEGTVYDFVAAIHYAIDQHVDVINMSVGIGNDDEPELADAVAEAKEAGIVMAAAVGNDAESYVEYPAAYDGVYGVGAYNSLDRLAGFSHTGPGVDFVAPGVSIYSTYLKGGYKTMQGTSMATPFVTKALALAKSANHAMTNETLNDLAIGAATRFGNYQPLQIGAGKLDVTALMNGVYATNSAVRYYPANTTTDQFKTWRVKLSAKIAPTAQNLSYVSIVNTAGDKQPVAITIDANIITIAPPAKGYAKGTYYIQIDEKLTSASGKRLKQQTINEFTVQ